MNLLRTKSLITLPSLGGAAPGGLSLAALRAQLADADVGAVSLYLPSTYATSAWQRYDATTGHSVMSGSVGFFGDMLQGMELGPELIVNGDFSNGLTGWVAEGSTLEIVNGALKITQTGTSTGYARSAFDGIVTVGQFFVTNSSSINDTGVSSAYLTNCSVPVPVGFAITRSLTSVMKYYRRNTGGAGTYSYSDNCTLKLLKGYHSIQPSDVARPTLLFNGRVYYLAHTAGQKLTAYLPSAVGSTCTVIYASPGVGAQVVTGVPIVSQACDLMWNHSGLVILPSTATADQVAQAAVIINPLSWRTAV